MRSKSYAGLAWSEPVRKPEDLSTVDPGIGKSVSEAVGWLSRAQDASTSADGGVAAWFDLRAGWSTSYPETTGYIVPTLLDYAERTGDEALRERAKRMLDWLVSIQFESGAFQGGIVGKEPCLPVTFNTGQVLLGLAAGVRVFGDEYLTALRKAADWLVDTQESDGSWLAYPSPFTAPGAKTYEIQVAWGLLEAAQVTGEGRYAAAALANVDWALDHQQPNGWFQQCDLWSHEKPLTHTLAYALRGVAEAYRYSEASEYLVAACRTGDALLKTMDSDGFIAGRLDREWRNAASWACLTGTAQISACWLLLTRGTGDARYRDAAYRANEFVRRTMRFDGTPGSRGGVAGSFPVNGGYCAHQFPNWACKFFVDANLLEQDSRWADA